MKFSAILQVTVFKTVEADTYKEAVKKAEEEATRMNNVHPVDVDPGWIVEQVHRDDEEV